MLVVWNTEPQDMLAGTLRIMIPYAQAFMLVTAFWFIPILLAARIKGFRALKYGIIHPVQTAVTILNPHLANLVRKSGFLALSVECRGFSPRRQQAGSQRAPPAPGRDDGRAGLGADYTRLA